jgi:hypothetical protein
MHGAPALQLPSRVDVPGDAQPATMQQTTMAAVSDTRDA